MGLKVEEGREKLLQADKVAQQAAETSEQALKITKENVKNDWSWAGFKGGVFGGIIGGVVGIFGGAPGAAIGGGLGVAGGAVIGGAIQDNVNNKIDRVEGEKAEVLQMKMIN